MSDGKKYYYLRLKENFFDSDEMILLESMQDGYKYSNILLKLYLRSLKYEGRLMLKGGIPFDSQMIATVTRHSVGDVEKAVRMFKQLNLVDILDNGAIYMLDMQELIGRSSTEADRKRRYRAKIENEKKLGHLSRQTSDNPPPEIELEKEIDIDIKNSVAEKSAPNSKRPSHVYSTNDSNYKIANYLYQKILSNNPDFKTPNLQKWANDARLMVEKDKRSKEQIKKVIDFAQTDSFWIPNILSVAKLRKQFDRLFMEYKTPKRSSRQNVIQKETVPDWPQKAESQMSDVERAALKKKLQRFKKKGVK